MEKPMSEIRVYPGTIIDGGGSKVIFTLTPIIGETREEYEHRCQEVFKLAVSFVAPAGPTFEVADTSRYRKVGEHSYEIIAPGYKPEEKPVSERDSHFAGFAKLLLGEIQSEYGGFVDVTPAMTQLETLIAQRAYDLVWHTLHAVGLDDDSIPFQDVYRPEEDIPDLTEWPE